jgi:hypothetical protein
MMMLWIAKMKKYLGTSWGGEIGEKKGYNIMGDHISKEITKSTLVMKDGGKIIK